MYLVKFVLQYFKGALSPIQRDTLHEVLRVLVARSFCQYRDVAVLLQQRHHTITTPNSSSQRHRPNTVPQTPCLNPRVANTLSRPHCPKHSVQHTDSAQINAPQQQKNCATGVLRRNCVNRNHMCLNLLEKLVAEEGLEPPTRGL